MGQRAERAVRAQTDRRHGAGAAAEPIEQTERPVRGIRRSVPHLQLNAPLRRTHPHGAPQNIPHEVPFRIDRIALFQVRPPQTETNRKSKLTYFSDKSDFVNW